MKPANSTIVRTDGNVAMSPWDANNLRSALAGMPAAGLTLIFFALTGCASPQPPPEFAIYQRTFSEAQEATDRVLAVHAPFERAVRKPPDESKFDPDEARYIVDDAPTGVTELIVRGFSAIDSYNQVLVRYVAGESIETIRPQIGLFAKQASLAAGVVVPGAGAAISAGGALLVEVADAILTVADRAEFRRGVEENSEQIIKFIDVLRESSRLMYSTGFTALNERIAALARERKVDEIEILQDQQRQYRILLARWVLLLDETKGAVTALQIAVVDDASSAFTAAQLAFWTDELSERAQSIRLSAFAFRDVL